MLMLTKLLKPNNQYKFDNNLQNMKIILMKYKLLVLFNRLFVQR